MEFNKMFTHISPAGTITDAGIVEIIRLIQSQNLTTGDWRALNPDTAWQVLPALPETWDWVWIVSKGTYAGTFPKRVRNFYYKQHGIKVLDTFVQQIGEIARAHSAESATYRYEFVTDFDWSAGDFGDSGSCYWGGRSDAREMLADNDGWAIRFYADQGNGFARAWVYKADDSLYVVWNGYGKPFANPTLTIARIVAAHFNLSYKKIYLSNNGNTSGTLYINSGIGYAVATPETLEGMTSFDFEWDDPNSTSCSNCGDYIHEDDIYYGADDQPYCRNCYYEYFSDCDNCGETYDRDNLHYVEGEGEYCEYCLGQLFDSCENCGEYTRHEDMVEANEHWYCRDCHTELNPPETAE